MMDYKKPAEVVGLMIETGTYKSKLSPKDLLIRGMLAGSLLGFGTTLSITASVQTGMPVIGALFFPACFVTVILLGFELVTGSFAMLPTAWFDGKVTMPVLLKNWLYVYLGNMIGGALYAFLYWGAITHFGHGDHTPLSAAIIKLAESKTIGYMADGPVGGWFTCFTKGILCNWMVSLGVVMGLTSTSTSGKIMAAWLPIFIFFAQGFEHCVVNMFVVPAAMLMGADISFGQWFTLNQIPATIGNIVGGVLFTALALYLTHGPKKQAH
ncbi:MAG: formate/nitrite transporter family protein [Candidatus Pseudobacter hemicellulosilyticus]|uniref:Formate/nitrite transporter family protein n=1 Tax=Candidatus Pseudobacter hemicellulosilyticus TaxID=3121375 RepID=A0AAJ6BFY7_9BACT|nr:MAG: formate/nitrite transporter family protein [Pseudobacter sp.]